MKLACWMVQQLTRYTGFGVFVTELQRLDKSEGRYWEARYDEFKNDIRSLTMM